MNLAQLHCKPCEGGEKPLTKLQAMPYIEAVPEWTLSSDGLYIQRAYRFADFKHALDFVNKIGVIAEHEGHHPDLKLGWGRVEVRLSTHAIKGLSENDFILAYQIDNIKKS